MKDWKDHWFNVLGRLRWEIKPTMAAKSSWNSLFSLTKNSYFVLQCHLLRGQSQPFV